MNVSLYQAAAAMNANARWQEVIAENLAANSTPGARRQEISFAAVEAGMAQGVGGAAGGRISMPTSSTATNFQQAPLRSTNVPTDLAIEGPGFFEVQLPNGSRAYTRDGELHLNAQGQIITKQGNLVMGDGGPLQLDPANQAPISVSPGGEISQAGELKGRLRLVEFAQPGSLRPMGHSYFLAENPEARPMTAQSSQLRQGFLETANSAPTTEMSSLLNAMRMFEANQKVIQMQDERMGRVISDLGTPS